MDYFARVSAANILGFGQRRLSRPPVVTVPLQSPAVPGGLYHGGTKPTLRVASATALEVEIGPPAFDGGDALTYFRIEWDTSADFTSNDDSEPLGRATIAAAETLCDDCVLGFDLVTNTFNYTGEANDVRQLASGRKFYVAFPDDSISYMFTVRSGDAYAPTRSTIYVESDHARVSSLSLMMTSLRVLGTSYLIVDLMPGRLSTPSVHVWLLMTYSHTPAQVLRACCCGERCQGRW